MEKVIFDIRTLEYLDRLFLDLFEKGYFDYEENTIQYILDLKNYIVSKAPLYTRYETPKQLKHLGRYYITYQSNRRTTWYILFFTKKDNILVRHIFNNHCQEATYF